MVKSNFFVEEQFVDAGFLGGVCEPLPSVHLGISTLQNACFVPNDVDDILAVNLITFKMLLQQYLLSNTYVFQCLHNLNRIWVHEIFKSLHSVLMNILHSIPAVELNWAYLMLVPL